MFTNSPQKKTLIILFVLLICVGLILCYLKSNPHYMNKNIDQRRDDISGVATTTQSFTGVTAEPDSRGVVKGFVTLSPTCDLSREREGGCESGFATDIAVYHTGGSLFVMGKSKSDGSYELVLPRGDYVIVPQSESKIQRCESKTVVVSENETIELNFVCDSGLR